MGVIMTGTFPKLLRPGIEAIFGGVYNEYPPQYSQIFKEYPSVLAYEEDVLVSGTSQAVIKAEGTAVTYDTMRQGYIPLYRHVTAGLGYIITLEEKMDNRYPELNTVRAEALARSLRDLKEQIAANVLNNGFATAGADGQPLFSASHPVTGAVQSNIVSPALDFSEAALEQITIAISQAKGPNGLPIGLRTRKIIIPPGLVHEAERILKNPLRPHTAERDINAMYQEGSWPEGYSVNIRLTDPDAFFVLTDCPNSFKYFNRMSPEFSSDNDFDTANEKNKAIERYSFGYSDFRGAWASQGI